MSLSDLYPQGMTLHSIGYAALKYPELPPELPVPIGNQIGVLQRSPLSGQIRVMTQVASQYLPALLEYQYSDAPELHDPSNAQYYFSNCLCLLNYLASQPDVSIRLSKHPRILHDTIDKLLMPDIEEKMKACQNTRMMGATFEADFGSMLQFVSTLLLRKQLVVGNSETVHPRIYELSTRLRAWKKKYPGQYIGRVSDRLADQIENSDPNTVMVKEQQDAFTVCGYILCEKHKDMLACGNCKIQRYCSQEHQKKDWKNHKHICNKGLIDTK
ncbi:hypothetical protein BGZ60DRAFT_436535 [Tricladium varicosporioides]|nr:hypothetical protein BGZ60DRAFT_436535 [Hymenoscyphus varicosporioides]